MIYSLFLVIIVGMIFGYLFKQIKLPSLIGYILAGIVIGESGLGLLSEELYGVARELRLLALIIILLRAGLALNITELKKNGLVAILLSFLPALFEMLSMSMIAYALFKINYLEALLIGIVISAVSPAVIIPRMLVIIEKGNQRLKNLAQIIMASCSLEDVLIILVFTTVLQVGIGQSIDLSLLYQLPLSIIIGACIGVLIGKIITKVYEKLLHRSVIIDIMVLSISFVLLYFEQSINNYLPFSALLTILTLGISILIFSSDLASKMGKTYKKLWIGGELLLFVLIGAIVEVEYLTENFLLIIIALLGAFLFRVIGILLSLRKSRFTSVEKKFVICALTPKATVQAAIGALPLTYGMVSGELTLAFAIAVILISAPIGALLIDSFTKRNLR